MGPASKRHSQAAWFAFAGKAFLSADSAVLLRMAGELRNRMLPEEALEKGLSEMERALGQDPADLKSEFVRLFLDPAGARCPPFQSLYSDDRQLMGAAHRSAMAWFRAAGMEPKAAAEPADHIGLLLAFYARLLELESPDVVSAFRDEHLAWVPAYCEQVILETRHPFYRFLAEATRTLLG
jgi:TorA maturation chaperone TorD